MSEYKIPIPSRVYNAAVGGHVAGADQIIDDKTGLTLDKVAGGALEEKEYTSSSNNGMGRVVLRKNLVNGVNTLTQSMINKSNTIYVIQYDFDLNGEEIEIPTNCILNFNGGQINNGILIGLFDISGVANSSNVLYKTIGTFGEKTCTIKFNGVIDNNLLPTYTECRFANKYNVPVIINKKYGTPTRYGAKGDATTDCSDAIQCLFDILSYDGGDADFRRVSNDGMGLFKITRQLVVKSIHNPSQGYKSRTALGKIFGDAGSTYTNMENNAYASSIIAYGLNELEAAIFFSGNENGWPVGTSISGMKIIANDESNNALSFAFKGISMCHNIFSQCIFIGKNGVLAHPCDIASPGGYSLILVKWDSCVFTTTLEDAGYAYTSGYHLLKGLANDCTGDQVMFENCFFNGTVECDFYEGMFISCMWAVRNLNTKLSGTITELGLTNKSFTQYPDVANIDYGACINVVRCSNLSFFNCYYEDHRGIFNLSQDYSYGVLNINSCYLNGITNQTYNNSLSKYVIKLKENNPYNTSRPVISIDKCVFRIVDGDKTGFSDGVVINNSKKAIIRINDFMCNNESKQHLINNNIGPIVINGTKPKFRFSTSQPITTEYRHGKALLSDMYQKDYIHMLYPSVVDNVYISMTGITKDTSIPESEICSSVYFFIDDEFANTINIRQSDIINNKVELFLPTQESINMFLAITIKPNSKLSLRFSSAQHIEEFIGGNINVVVGLE